MTLSDAQSIKKCSPIIYFLDKKIKVDQVNSKLSAIELFSLCASRIITSKNPKKDHLQHNRCQISYACLPKTHDSSFLPVMDASGG